MTVWRKLWLIAASAILLAYAFEPLPAQPQAVPYYIRQQATPVSAVSQSFVGMQGQGTCAFSLNSTGGANTTVTSAVSSFPTGASTPIQFVDANGNAMGSNFSTTAQINAWFNAANATNVVFTLTTANSYTYTLVCTNQAWPFGTIGWHQGNNNGASVYNVYADYWPDALGLAQSASITTAGTTLLLTGAAGLHWYVFYADCQAQGTLTAPSCNIITGGGASCGTNTKQIHTQGVPGPIAAGQITTLVGSGVVFSPVDRPLIAASSANVCGVAAGTLTPGLTFEWYAVQGP